MSRHFVPVPLVLRVMYPIPRSARVLLPLIHVVFSLECSCFILAFLHNVFCTIVPRILPCSLQFILFLFYFTVCSLPMRSLHLPYLSPTSYCGTHCHDHIPPPLHTYYPISQTFSRPLPSNYHTHPLVCYAEHSHKPG